MSRREKEDLEDTRVARIDLPEGSASRSQRRDRACLLVLAGGDVGRMYKLRDGPTVIGRSHKVDIRLDDDSISRRHSMIVMKGSSAKIEDLASSNGTLVNGREVSVATLQDGDKIRIGETAILKFTFHDRLDESFQRKMYAAALRDPLTKLYNKKYFLDHLANEVAYAKRHQTPLSLIMLDIDHFKSINDQYGHVTGDEALVGVANIMSGLLREEDVLARYGGEEFAVICRGLAIDTAGRVAERLRAKVEASPIATSERHLRLTLSAGVAELVPEHQAPVSLIKEADAALYAAKRGGRNRVCFQHQST